MNSISIVVAGKTGCGKSTITDLIRTALSGHGFTIRTFDDGPPEVPLAERLEALKAKKTEVFIKVVRTARDLTPDAKN